MASDNNSHVATVAMSAALAAIAIAMIASALLAQRAVRIYLVSAGVGLFCSLGIVLITILQNGGASDELIKTLQSPQVVSCPDFWTTDSNGCTTVCKPTYTQADGRTVNMAEGAADIDITMLNTQSDMCTDLAGKTYPYTDLRNRCNAASLVT